MSHLVEAKVHNLLKDRLHYKDYDCGTILDRMTMLARMAGHDLDDRFAFAGLGAGPEARVASRLARRALLGQGDETPDYEIRKTIDMWLRTNKSSGRR